MNKNEMYSELFDFNASTYHRWKKEKRPILKLIEYFTSKEIIEFLETGKIQKFEKYQQQDVEQLDKINDHILFDSLKKIHEIPNLFLLGKKEFWLKGFLEAVQNTKFYNKNEFIDELMGLDQKFYESKNWKKLTADWIENNLSKLEVEILLKNKDRVIRELSI